MIGVKAASRGGRKIVPGHVGLSDVDPTVRHDVLGVVDPSVTGIFAVTAVRAVPSGHHEQFDLHLSRTHIGICAASISCTLQGSQHWLDHGGSMGPMPAEEPK